MAAALPAAMVIVLTLRHDKVVFLSLLATQMPGIQLTHVSNL
jgi:hypothetical protein